MCMSAGGFGGRSKILMLAWSFVISITESSAVKIRPFSAQLRTTTSSLSNLFPATKSHTVSSRSFLSSFVVIILCMSCCRLIPNRLMRSCTRLN